MSVFIKCGRIRGLEGEEACAKLSAVKWSGKNEFLSGKSQGISFLTKSGHPAFRFPVRSKYLKAEWKTLRILISWLHQKPADLDPQC